MFINFYILLFSIFISSTSYSKNETPEQAYIIHNYSLKSIESSEPVYLNNNSGGESRDLLSQILSKNNANNISKPDMLNYTAQYVYKSETKSGTITLPYPFQFIEGGNTTSSRLLFYVVQYPSFSYVEDTNNEINITNIEKYYQFADYGVVESASKINENSMVIRVVAKLYNFKEHKWIDSIVELTFIKNETIK